MNKTIKNILIIACAMVLAGAILVGAAFAFGARFEKMYNVSWPNSSVNIGGNGMTGYRAWDNDFSEDGSYSVSADELDSIDLKWIAGYAELIVYDGKEVLIKESSADPIAENDALRYGMDNGVLYIQYCAKDKAGNLPEKNLSLSVPRTLAENMASFSYDASSASLSIADVSAKNFTFSSSSGRLDASLMLVETVILDASSGDLLFSGEYIKLDADTSSGKVTVESLGTASGTTIGTSSGNVRVSGNCGALSINTTSGTITSPSSIDAESLYIDTSSGDVSLSGAFPQVNVNTTSGRIALDCAVCPNALDANTSSGDITLTLPDNSGFSLRYDTSSGDLNSGFSVLMSGGKYISGDGSATFNVDTSSGSLQLKVG